MKISISFALILAAAAWAQAPRPGAPGRFGGPRMLGAEAGILRHVVKGAPFSGDLVTESTETLADGNRIHQTSTVHLVRDSEGRVRREESLAGLGALAAGGSGEQVIFIHDPVAGASYALDPAHKTATRSAWTPGAPGSRVAAAVRAWRGMGPGGNQSATAESLGSATMEGLAVEGTRIAITTPAGAIGNEAPIQVVTERWYSPDLKIAVLIKRSDPRSGETVTRLTNVSRAEPAPGLFQVPTDYKVTERAAPRFGPPAGASGR